MVTGTKDFDESVVPDTRYEKPAATAKPIPPPPSLFGVHERSIDSREFSTSSKEQLIPGESASTKSNKQLLPGGAREILDG